MRFKHRPNSPLQKRARRGFRGYPLATVAFYGPDATKAGKAAVGIVTREDAEPEIMERWFAEDRDVRTDPAILREIMEFMQRHGAMSRCDVGRDDGPHHWLPARRRHRLSGRRGVPEVSIL